MPLIKVYMSEAQKQAVEEFAGVDGRKVSNICRFAIRKHISRSRKRGQNGQVIKNAPGSGENALTPGCWYQQRQKNEHPRGRGTVESKTIYNSPLWKDEAGYICQRPPQGLRITPLITARIFPKPAPKNRRKKESRKNTWSEVKENILIQLINEGWHSPELADRFGVSIAAISFQRKKLIKHGRLERKSKSWTTLQLRWLRANYHEKGGRECARILGRTYSAVMQKVMHEGLSHKKEAV